jgi:hypothetical protein
VRQFRLVEQMAAKIADEDERGAQRHADEDECRRVTTAIVRP